ncbi:MAG TPA: glycosyltransferase [Allosphingosinicella sp.]|nr:glycosyltransferase [Allosphingosinicella sp.]
MLRVLVLSSRFPDIVRPNAGNIVERTILALAGRPDVEVEVVAPVGSPPFPLSLRRNHARMRPVPSEEIWKGLKVRRPRYRTVPYLPELAPRSIVRTLLPILSEARRDFPFDVIAAQFFWPEGPAAVELGRRLGVPVSVKGRGPDVESWARRRGAGRMIVEAGRKADGMLAINADLKRQMAALGMPEERIAVHYTGVDRALFRPADRAAEKARIGVPGPLLLSVGNLIPRKGHLLVLDALTRLEGATLIVAGGGPDYGLLRDRAAALGVAGRVRLLGLVPYELMPALYVAADVTVHAASLEGFANVRVESLACGTPVVTTAPGGADELIRSPQAGRIVAPDPAAIAAAALELIQRPPSAEEVVSAVERFSWERNAAEMYAHLRSLAEKRASA